MADDFEDKVFDSSAKDLHNKGNALYKEGKYREAIECYTEALKIDPELLESYFNRALAETRLGRYIEALEDLNKCLEQDFGIPETFYTRGLVKEYMKDYPQAALDYAHSIAIDEKYSKAFDQLEVCVHRAMRVGEHPSSSYSNSKTPSWEGDRDLSSFEPFKEKVLDLTFDDYGGDSKQKALFKQICVLFLNRELIRKRGGQLPGGVLLYGEPGTGKTYLARILANEIDATFYNVKGSDIFSKWFGDTDKNLRKLFDEAAAQERSIVFFDEIDGIATRRRDEDHDLRAERRVLNTLLAIMDGFDDKYNNVMVVGATNDFEVLDPAFLRPGRFDHIIEVKKPDSEGLKQIYRIQLDMIQRQASEPMIADDIDYTRLAKISEGFVGDEIKEIVERAVNRQILREIDSKAVYKVSTEHLIEEIRGYKEDRDQGKERPIGFIGID